MTKPASRGPAVTSGDGRVVPDPAELRSRPKPVIHICREDLGMRQMRGDDIAQRHKDRWYLTACGVEAPSAETTNLRVLGPLAAAFNTLCTPCKEATDA